MAIKNKNAQIYFILRLKEMVWCQEHFRDSLRPQVRGGELTEGELTAGEWLSGGTLSERAARGTLAFLSSYIDSVH